RFSRDWSSDVCSSDLPVVSARAPATRGRPLIRNCETNLPIRTETAQSSAAMLQPWERLEHRRRPSRRADPRERGGRRGCEVELADRKSVVEGKSGERG